MTDELRSCAKHRDCDGADAHCLQKYGHPANHESMEERAEAERLEHKQECEQCAALRSRLEEVEKELNTANAKAADAKKDAASWQSHWRMYRDAWVRELGGWLLPKSHEIDALVLTTRRRCVNPILGHCNTPHWLGEPTSDRKAIQQTPHPNEAECRNWEATKLPDSYAESLQSRVIELEEALRIALRQWEGYVSDNRNEDLGAERHAEARMYRDCRAVLTPAAPKEQP